jgi:hypothetical protein
MLPLSTQHFCLSSQSRTTGQNGDAARAVRATGPFTLFGVTGGNVSELPVPSATRLKSPSWLDGRLVIGVVLVLLSVVVGAKIIASSQRYDVMWAASRDIAPGTTLIKADLLQVDVRFKDHGALYISTAGASPVGRVTVSPLADGQLIPLAAVPATPPPAVRLVTIPVARLHMPRGNDLHGVQVDLYVTPKTLNGEAQAKPQLVLANVTIADTIVDSSLGGDDGSGVVLSVPVAFVDAVVAAAQLGSVDLVRVPSAGGVTAGPPTRSTAVTSPSSPSPSPSDSAALASP